MVLLMALKLIISMVGMQVTRIILNLSGVLTYSLLCVVIFMRIQVKKI